MGLLESFGVRSDSGRCVAFAQCMGGAMFLRSLVRSARQFDCLACMRVAAQEPENDLHMLICAH